MNLDFVDSIRWYWAKHAFPSEIHLTTQRHGFSYQEIELKKGIVKEI